MCNDDGQILKDHGNQPVQHGCNKRVNAHNGLRDSDDGVQSIHNTTCPNLPTAAFMIGSPRTIVFMQMIKAPPPGSKFVDSWSKTDCKHQIESKMEDVSILALAASNDK